MVTYEQASADQSKVDLTVCRSITGVATAIIQILGTFVVLSQVAWEIFIVIVPVTAACLRMQVSFSLLLPVSAL